MFKDPYHSVASVERMIVSDILGGESGYSRKYANGELASFRNARPMQRAVVSIKAAGYNRGGKGYNCLSGEAQHKKALQQPGRWRPADSNSVRQEADDAVLKELR